MPDNQNNNQYIHPRIFTAIKSWLCGQLTYKPLVIQHPDYEDFHFNVIMNDPEDIVVNDFVGIQVHVICDSGGCWRNLRSTPFDITGGRTVTYNNMSQDNDYNYPQFEFTMESAGAFSITNQKDNNRTTEFTDLQAGEKITVKRSGELISSTGLMRMGNFNKKYLRLVRGPNMLLCSAGATSIIITPYSFVRMGG